MLRLPIGYLCLGCSTGVTACFFVVYSLYYSLPWSALMIWFIWLWIALPCCIVVMMLWFGALLSLQPLGNMLFRKNNNTHLWHLSSISIKLKTLQSPSHQNKCPCFAVIRMCCSWPKDFSNVGESGTTFYNTNTETFSMVWLIIPTKKPFTSYRFNNMAFWICLCHGFNLLISVFKSVNLYCTWQISWSLLKDSWGL